MSRGRFIGLTLPLLLIILGAAGVNAYLRSESGELYSAERGFPRMGQCWVETFSILGIDTSEMLDPSNPTAFVTGLSFMEPGLANFTMTPITTDTDTNVIPEPSSLTLFGGLLSLILVSRRKKTWVTTFSTAT